MYFPCLPDNHRPLLISVQYEISQLADSWNCYRFVFGPTKHQLGVIFSHSWCLLHCIAVVNVDQFTCFNLTTITLPQIIADLMLAVMDYTTPESLKSLLTGFLSVQKQMWQKYTLRHSKTQQHGLQNGSLKSPRKLVVQTEHQTLMIE